MRLLCPINTARIPRYAIAKACVQEFHIRFQSEIEASRANPRSGLLHDFLNGPTEVRLTDEEIRRNALIILFGGISTVEAVILNSLWALLTHPPALSLVRENRSLLDAAFHEAVRWMAPVQSATRHTVGRFLLLAFLIPAGATVNCMLGSANRDAQFSNVLTL
ncbi:MAG: cytochrome P450 [Sphingomonadales bacterium]|nr:cytochrome P450 [Sphingomonadales bacterium]